METSGQVASSTGKRALLGVMDHRLRNAVGAEHGHRAVGNFVQFLDEMSALLLQRLDDMPVVNDFVAHIDGLAALLQRAFDDVDRPDDARAQKPRG